jgi:hypothetical protein
MRANKISNQIIIGLMLCFGNTFAQETAQAPDIEFTTPHGKKKDSTEIQRENAKLLAEFNKRITALETELLKSLKTINFDSTLADSLRKLNDQLAIESKKQESLEQELLKREKELLTARDSINSMQKLLQSKNDEFVKFCKDIMATTQIGTINNKGISSLTSDIDAFNKQSNILQQVVLFLDNGVLPSTSKNYLELKNQLSALTIDVARFKKQSELQKLLIDRFTLFDGLAAEFKELITDMSGIKVEKDRKTTLENLSLQIGINQYPYLTKQYKAAEKGTYSCPW